MENLLREIGERVRQARQARGLSQADLAELLNVSDGYISKVELGKNAMTVTVLVKLSDALNVSADWLLRNKTREAQEYTIAELEEVFTDCEPSELQALLNMLQQMKTTIRSIKKSDRK